MFKYCNALFDYKSLHGEGAVRWRIVSMQNPRVATIPAISCSLDLVVRSGPLRKAASFWGRPLLVPCQAFADCSTRIIIHHPDWYNRTVVKKTPWLNSESELYRPSDRRLSVMLVPTFADREMPCGERGKSLWP
jgi:hypothetical protein